MTLDPGSRPATQVEWIRFPSGRDAVHGAAGEGWVLAHDGVSVVGWSPSSGFVRAEDHPPFVSRIVPVAGGFLVHADDGGAWHLGFFANAERRFTWWRTGGREWPELEGGLGPHLTFGDAVVCAGRDARPLRVVLRATPTALERLGSVDVRGDTPRFLWRCPRTGDLFLGGLLGLYCASLSGGNLEPVAAKAVAAPDLAGAQVVCRNGTVVLVRSKGWPRGYSLATGSSALLPVAVTRAPEPWDAFIEGDTARVERFVSLMATIGADATSPVVLGMTFSPSGSPIAVLREGIVRLASRDGDEPGPDELSSMDGPLASWLYLSGSRAGRASAFAALLRSRGPTGLAGVLAEREGPDVFPELVRFVRRAPEDPMAHPCSGVTFLVDALGARSLDDAFATLEDAAPAVAAAGCAALRSSLVVASPDLAPPSGRAYQRLLNLLGSREPGTILEAHETLLHRKLPIPASRLRSLLRHEDPLVRSQACSGALADREAMSAGIVLEELAALLRSERDVDSRRGLATSLSLNAASQRLLALAAADVSPLVRAPATAWASPALREEEIPFRLSLLDAVLLAACTRVLARRRSPDPGEPELPELQALVDAAGPFGESAPGAGPPPAGALDVILVARAGLAALGAGALPWNDRDLETVASRLSSEGGPPGPGRRGLEWLRGERSTVEELARFAARIPTRPSAAYRIAALALLGEALGKRSPRLVAHAPSGSLTARLREAGSASILRVALSVLRVEPPSTSARALAQAALAAGGDADARRSLREMLASAAGDDVPVGLCVLLELAPSDLAARDDLAAILLSPGLPLARRWQLASSLGEECRVRLEDLGPGARRALASEVVASPTMPFPERRLAGEWLAELGDAAPLDRLRAETASGSRDS